MSLQVLDIYVCKIVKVNMQKREKWERQKTETYSHMKI